MVKEKFTGYEIVEQCGRFWISLEAYHGYIRLRPYEPATIEWNGLVWRVGTHDNTKPGDLPLTKWPLRTHKRGFLAWSKVDGQSVYAGYDQEKRATDVIESTVLAVEARKEDVKIW